MFVNTPLEECEKRDVKGLYKKARTGIIRGFTGIDQAYEQPDSPELELSTLNKTIEETAQEVISMLEEAGIIPRDTDEKVDEFFVPEIQLSAAKNEAEKLESLEINKIDLQWLQFLSEGWAFPLKGFMRKDGYIQCTGFSCTTTEKVTNQSIPIVLPVSREDKEMLKG